MPTKEAATMFAPKVASMPTKVAEDSAKNAASRHAALANTLFRQSAIGDRATSRLLLRRPEKSREDERYDDTDREADRADTAGGSAAPGVSFDFGRVRLLPSERSGETDARSAGAGPAPRFLQAALAVGQVNDPLEHEADRIADRVMRMPDPNLPTTPAPSAPVLQAQAAGSSAAAIGEAPAIVHEVLRAPGRALDRNSRAVMEPRFGYDFGKVRIHADTRAGESARAVGARAYTVGTNIVFGAGEFAPATNAGQRLLAHELAHVVQQGTAPSAPKLLRQSDTVKTDAPQPASGSGAMTTASALTANQPAVADTATAAAAPPTSGQPDSAAGETAPAQVAPVHYRFEIKAWIPFPQVPDPEEPVQEAGFRLTHLDWDVQDYASQYRGDGHGGYDGSYRVLQVAEFDWDGKAISKLTFPSVAHFGTSHRDFSVSVRTTGSAENWRLFKATAVATTDHTVTSATPSRQEVDLGMSSPNPLTVFPAPNIDADYSFFISQDTFNIETVTVRWTTDLMPNHGYRVVRNGAVVKEHIVNTLAAPPSSAEIFVRLNSKSNGGADTFEPANNPSPGN
jgi:Domain of unknown function (DUF4157)